MSPPKVMLGEVTPEVYGRLVGDLSEPSYFGLHGWSGDHRTFDPILPYLPAQSGLLTVDQPGFGRSARPETWTYDDYTRPLLAALDAAGWTRGTLIGNCAGAVIGLEMALRARERFDRLVLIDPFAYVPWYFALLTRGWPGWFFYHFTFANPVGRFITNQALRAKRTEETDLVSGFESVRHDVAFSYLRMLCARADAQRFAELDLPVTLLFGERTFSAVKRSVDIYSRLWPQAEAHCLPEAGHLPIQEATESLALHTLQEGGPRWRTHPAPSIRCGLSSSSLA